MEVVHRASCAVPEELLTSLVRCVALDILVAAGKTLLWLLLAADQSVEPSLTFHKLPDLGDGKINVATTGKKSQVIPENKDAGESDDDEDEDGDDDGDDQDDDGGEEYSGDEGKENEGEEDDDDDPEANGVGGSDDEDDDDDDDDEDDDDDDEDEDEDEDEEEDEELEQPPSKKRK